MDGDWVYRIGDNYGWQLERLLCEYYVVYS
jgi:hypothetical protein